MSEQEFNAVFSKRLKYYINKYDMTQSELAKRLGVSTQSVTNWCKGAKSPRMDKVDAMCKIFNCRRSDLMEDSSDKPQTIAAHLDTDDLTEAEFEDVANYIAFLKSKRDK